MHDADSSPDPLMFTRSGGEFGAGVLSDIQSDLKRFNSNIVGFERPLGSNV